jgi:EAL domain-containing protein (putative c-di-GMP-specific phosphodiesterase class I)
LIAAAEFIPLAERTGLIRPLSLWALEAALRQCRDWHQIGLSPQVAVNLASDNLYDEQLALTIARLLEEAVAQAGWLTVEVTERAILADRPRARAMLDRLHEMGVRIAIEDIGSGYSSLGLLKEVPANDVKVDQGVVKAEMANEQDACIVRSVIDLSHNLGKRVVAEGVEDQASLDLLASWGCDLVQGYHISRPLPVPDLMTWMVSSPESRATEGGFTPAPSALMSC